MRVRVSLNMGFGGLGPETFGGNGHGNWCVLALGDECLWVSPQPARQGLRADVEELSSRWTGILVHYSD